MAGCVKVVIEAARKAVFKKKKLAKMESANGSPKVLMKVPSCVFIGREKDRKFF